jgi:hypothetical protein
MQPYSIRGFHKFVACLKRDLFNSNQIKHDTEDYIHPYINSSKLEK